MTQPNAEPHLDELDHALNAELAKDLPGANLRHQRLGPSPVAEAAGPPRPPVGPKAGAGGASWGPASPTPTMTAQLTCIHDDAQRLIDALTDMQKALAIIREKL